MAGTFRMGEQARRAIRSRLVLQRNRRRQRALRRNWYRLSRAEVGRELVAIGRELFEAAPLFFPRALDSNGKTASTNGPREPLRNGHHRGLPKIAAAGDLRSMPDACDGRRRRKRVPRVESLEDKAWDELADAGECVLDELERIVRDPEDGEPRAEASG